MYAYLCTIALIVQFGRFSHMRVTEEFTIHNNLVGWYNTNPLLIYKMYQYFILHQEHHPSFKCSSFYHQHV